jgi:hypothetical protein
VEILGIAFEVAERSYIGMKFIHCNRMRLDGRVGVGEKDPDFVDIIPGQFVRHEVLEN